MFTIDIVPTFVPTMKKGKIIRLRVEEDLFYRFKNKVKKSNESISEVIRIFMSKYVNK